MSLVSKNMWEICVEAIYSQLESASYLNIPPQEFCNLNLQLRAPWYRTTRELRYDTLYYCYNHQWNIHLEQLKGNLKITKRKVDVANSILERRRVRGKENWSAFQYKMFLIIRYWNSTFCLVTSQSGPSAGCRRMRYGGPESTYFSLLSTCHRKDELSMNKNRADFK